MLVTVDTGGTKTLIAAFGRDGEIDDTIKFPTPVDQNEYVTLLRTTLQKTMAISLLKRSSLRFPVSLKTGLRSGAII